MRVEFSARIQNLPLYACLFRNRYSRASCVFPTPPMPRIAIILGSALPLDLDSLRYLCSLFSSFALPTMVLLRACGTISVDSIRLLRFKAVGMVAMTAWWRPSAAASRLKPTSIFAALTSFSISFLSLIILSTVLVNFWSSENHVALTIAALYDVRWCCRYLGLAGNLSLLRNLESRNLNALAQKMTKVS